MDIAVRAVDPHDDAALAAAHEVQATALAHDVPDLPAPCPVRYAGLLRHQTRAHTWLRWLATIDGTPAGVLDLTLPMLEDTANADVELAVVPAHRRRGVGRALYCQAVAALRDRDRLRMIAPVVRTLPGGPTREEAGIGFAEAMGAKEALSEVRRRLDLATVDLSGIAVREAPGYSVVLWRDRAPDEYLVDLERLSGRMVTDAPVGDLVYEVPQVDVRRRREDQQARLDRGERSYHAGIRHDATGRLVAWTALALEQTVPDHAWQHITIVDPAHRGHRLGLRVKLANLRFLAAHEPAVRMIDTWNAASNTHMIAINEAIGFRPVDAWGMWQHEI
jgi:GNAT superfamily N-acetyltransferase